MVTPIYTTDIPRRGMKKEDDHDDIKRGIRIYLNRLKPDNPVVSYTSLISQYWPEETRNDMIRFSNSIPRDQLRAISLEVERTIEVEHPALPSGFAVPMVFQINQSPNAFAKLWPVDATVRALSDRFRDNTDLDAACYRVAMCALDRGLVFEVLNFLRKNCTNHDQAYHLCPGWEPMLRRVNLHEKAYAIADCKRPARMPEVPPMMRMRLKWINNFLAMHELLGTFDKDLTNVYGSNEDCAVTLNGNYEVERPIGDTVFNVTFR